MVILEVFPVLGQLHTLRLQILASTNFSIFVRQHLAGIKFVICAFLLVPVVFLLAISEVPL